MAAIVDKLSESIPELAGAYDEEKEKMWNNAKVC